MTAPRPYREPARGDHAVATSAMELGGAVHSLRVCELDEPELELALERLAIESDAPAIGIAGARGADPAGLLLKATVYLRSLEARARARAHLAAIGGLATHIELTVAPPTSGAAAAILEWRIAGPGVTLGEGRTRCIEQPGAVWRFAAVDRMRRAEQPVAEQFHATMASASHGFDDTELASTLVRTWIYIGDINGYTEGRTGPIENYQAVNHARRVVFGELGLPERGGDAPYYPASTGIGNATDLLSLGLLTVRDTGGIRAVAIENPRQTSAFAYPRSASEVPPLFSRAVALCSRGEAMVLISGTASIVEARSVHLESAARQTEQTLANIRELLDPGVVAATGFRAAAGGLGALRGCIVYVKRASDVAAVQAVCNRHLPAVPTVFALADVCRPELLVEIEGIALLPGEVAP